MKNLKFIALATVATMSLPLQSMADTTGFTAHQSIANTPLEGKLTPEEKLEAREYLNYEEREPCQFYQPIPDGYMIDGCNLVKIQPKPQVVAHVEPAPAVVAPREVLAEYEVHFAFDDSHVEQGGISMLDKVASEINTHKPGEVTVAGHTDKAGPSAYNDKLSKARADNVSKALTERGVQHRVIDAVAYGEEKPAVDTADGVPLHENRRVVIEFLK